jgi:hypothetical protein
MLYQHAHVSPEQPIATQHFPERRAKKPIFAVPAYTTRSAASGRPP